MPAFRWNVYEITRSEDDVIRRRVGEIWKLGQIRILYVNSAKVTLRVPASSAR
jgi:hypothetical protein